MAVAKLQPIGAPGDLIGGVERGRAGARQIGTRGRARGGIIASVEPGSPADVVGIRPGDILTHVNDRKLRDAIDFQFFTAGEDSALLTMAGSGSVTVALGGLDTGITFTEPTFTPIRECNNHCPFCFIDQLPGEMRNSLYIRDDDYRYSFLFGNFVTLTNLNERDWERLAEQRLSPLYVSVHAVDRAMRRTLLGNDRAPDIREQLDRLASLGIAVHTQIVTCPGMNDGEVLEETLRDLAGRYPQILTVGVVPVGLTRTPGEILAGPAAHCSRILPSAADLPLRTFEPEEARRVVRQVRRHQRELRAEHGRSIVYASDEFYLLGNEPVPSAAFYDGYPQYENGIGMVRDLIDDWHRLRRRVIRQEKRPGRSATLICGEMIADRLGTLVEEWRDLTGARADLTVLTNTFFGSRVRVSGLLTGRDVVANARRYTGDVVILPAVMLDKTGSRLLDNWTPAELEAELGKPVRFAGYLSEVDRIVFDPSWHR